MLINEQIRDKEVRVVGENGEQLGIMSVQEAQALADEAGVDLVRIAPNAKPPVCRIVLRAAPSMVRNALKRNNTASQMKTMIRR